MKQGSFGVVFYSDLLYEVLTSHSIKWVLENTEYDVEYCCINFDPFSDLEHDFYRNDRIKIRKVSIEQNNFYINNIYVNKCKFCINSSFDYGLLVDSDVVIQSLEGFEEIMLDRKYPYLCRHANTNNLLTNEGIYGICEPFIKELSIEDKDYVYHQTSILGFCPSCLEFLEESYEFHNYMVENNLIDLNFASAYDEGSMNSLLVKYGSRNHFSLIAPNLETVNAGHYETIEDHLMLDLYTNTRRKIVTYNFIHNVKDIYSHEQVRNSKFPTRKPFIFDVNKEWF